MPRSIDSLLQTPVTLGALSLGANLDAPDVSTFYTPGPAGLVDYPSLRE